MFLGIPKQCRLQACKLHTLASETKGVRSTVRLIHQRLTLMSYRNQNTFGDVKKYGSKAPINDQNIRKQIQIIWGIIFFVNMIFSITALSTKLEKAKNLYDRASKLCSNTEGQNDEFNNITESLKKMDYPEKCLRLLEKQEICHHNHHNYQIMSPLQQYCNTFFVFFFPKPFPKILISCN